GSTPAHLSFPTNPTKVFCDRCLINSLSRPHRKSSCSQRRAFSRLIYRPFPHVRSTSTIGHTLVGSGERPTSNWQESIPRLGRYSTCWSMSPPRRQDSFGRPTSAFSATVPD